MVVLMTFYGLLQKIDLHLDVLLGISSRQNSVHRCGYPCQVALANVLDSHGHRVGIVFFNLCWVVAKSKVNWERSKLFRSSLYHMLAQGYRRHVHQRNICQLDLDPTVGPNTTT